MPRAVQLPSGATATLREARELKYRHRKQVLAHLGLSGDMHGNTSIDFGSIASRLEEALITAAVVSWDVPVLDEHGTPTGDVRLIPAHDPASLDELGVEDAMFLGEQVKELQQVLLPNFGADPSEASPTPPSGG